MPTKAVYDKLASAGGPENKKEGLFTGDAEDWTDVNLSAIPPNKPRPIETEGLNRKHLFGTFSD